ncbi:MAG TPA: hypothetical protein VF411_05755 [Bacteroidia bacterium]
MKNVITKVSIFFSILLVIFGCSKKVEDNLASPSLSFPPFSINLTLTKDSIVADGVTTAGFILKIDSSLAQKYSQVTFNITPIGNFSGGATTVLTTTIGINGITKVYVSSLQIGVSNITANVANLGSKSSSVRFFPSYPDEIVVQPSVAAITASYTSSVNITSTLIKNTGTVSMGLPIFYYDSTTTGGSIGVFINSTYSNNMGQSTATYSIQDTSYHGLLYLNCYVQNGPIKVRGRNKIVIQ